MHKQGVLNPYHGLLLNNNKELITDKCIINGPEKHYVAWKKAWQKILHKYGSIYMTSSEDKKLWREKSDQWMLGVWDEGTDYKAPQGIFWRDREILYLDYSGVYIC